MSVEAPSVGPRSLPKVWSALLGNHARRADRALDTLKGLQGEGALHEAMRQATLQRGKRLRAAIVYLVAEELGPATEGVDSLACAVELLHGASLILDDLPAMDDATERDGRPATHSLFGTATAILAAHSLVSLSVEVLASSPSLRPETANRLCLEAARTIGAAGMAEGQTRDLIEGETDELRVPAALDIAELKTATLFGLAAFGCGLLIGLDEARCEHLREFGLSLGRAYQILDDVRDDLPGEAGGERHNMRRLMGATGAHALFKSQLSQARRSLQLVGGGPRLSALVDQLDPLRYGRT